MRCILPIAFTLLLLTAGKTACLGQSSDSIKISYAERDTIYRRLNACKVLPELQDMVRQQNAELGLYKAGKAIDRAVIDSLTGQIGNYRELIVIKNEQVGTLNDLIKQHKKANRRVKLFTGVMVAPVSVVIGLLTGIFIAK
jgi:wobble nucleotide-excising tRNase